MTEPPFLTEARAAYDLVAADYADLLRDELDGRPFDLAMLGAFAECVRETGGGRVADLGCGPGRVTAYLAGLGLECVGIDLSPEMVAVARRDHPWHPTSRVADLAVAAGFSERARLVKAAEPPEGSAQAYLLVRKNSSTP
ncbi:class I SAM-dependent methyltransferase [Actinokineospora terrae]|uniref:Methyltransferase domain-containing protein n=1 Tax=Actinokineospora terrae TaxID=155974 RepID=A0A1H9MXQ2_9PSEU|nr:class I SAM-dependent methyltransferase [Actinokineospora terrae]SER27873.1 Methyltransferase domain-containing protein [Actinokineospora terrae]